MPILSVTVPPSPVDSSIDVWTCCICHHATTLVCSPPATGSTAAATFESHGWRALPGKEEVVCDRCKVLPDIANVLLAIAKVKTQ